MSAPAPAIASDARGRGSAITAPAPGSRNVTDRQWREDRSRSLTHQSVANTLRALDEAGKMRNYEATARIVTATVYVAQSTGIVAAINRLEWAYQHSLGDSEIMTCRSYLLQASGIDPTSTLYKAMMERPVSQTFDDYPDPDEIEADPLPDEIEPVAARKALFAKIREISQDGYAAGWLDGIERRLWALIDQHQSLISIEGPSPSWVYPFGNIDLTGADLDELIRLRTHAGCWPVHWSGAGIAMAELADVPGLFAAIEGGPR